MRTLLYDEHASLGAKIVSFAGWDMPLQYTGVIEEHHAVRTRAGLFDVSHMGRISVKGPDAEAFCDELCTNTITGKKDRSAIYGVLCRENGTAIDDVIVLRHAQDRCSIVSNASNRERVFKHLQERSSGWKVEVSPAYLQEGILALQGPLSREMASAIFPEAAALPAMSSFEQGHWIISGTGYTGEKGIEIFAPHEDLLALWRRLLDLGAAPVGLGARDTLRLEKGYALYGHELSDEIAPIESVSAWSVKLNKPHFIGKEALAALSASGKKRAQYGVVLEDAGIARAEYTVQQHGNSIGVVTSGGFSPSLKKSIALVMVRAQLQPGDEVEILIRGKPCKGRVVPLPFF